MCYIYWNGYYGYWTDDWLIVVDGNKWVMACSNIDCTASGQKMQSSGTKVR